MRRMHFVAVLTALVVSACAAPSTPTPIPTETQLPPATVTPLPPPTATLEPSPTPDPLIFRDDFDGALAPGWQWTHEKPADWSLKANPGWLQIMARAGGVRDGSITNLLMRQAPEGNFELETHLKFKPAGNFQIGALLIYESAAEFVQFGRAFCSSCVGDGFYLDLITGGKFTGDNFATKAPETDTVYLRLRHEAGTFTAYASEDGKQWRVIGSQSSQLKPMFVGLVADQAVQSVPGPAQFDYFLVNALH